MNTITALHSVYNSFIDLPLIVKILSILVVLLWLLRIFCRRPIKYKYHAIDNLFTDTERRFYFLLLESINGEFSLFAKVRVADVLKPNMKKKHWQGAFNKIKAKHFDYVLCDDNLNIIAAIELDDESHQRIDRMERDKFLNHACKTAKVPLIRFYTNQEYLPGQVYRHIHRQIK